MDLTEIRKEIDKVDGEILPLLIKRMKLSEQVAEYKRKNNIPVLNVKREQEILEKIKSQGGEYGNALQSVYASMMEISRNLQHSRLGGGEKLKAKIKNALPLPARTKGKTVACQGVSGAYSEKAAENLFNEPNILFYNKFEDVFRAVSEGEADFGVVPIENSSAGSVQETFDLMIKYRLFICNALDLPVNHCLLTKNNLNICEIKKAYSHPQALAQCADYLKAHNITPVPCSNTAAAAKLVSESDDCEIAAIASVEAAESFGLNIIDASIQSGRFNKTRFLVLSKKLFISDSAEKISLIFSLPHVPGSLSGVLSRFFRCGLNLTKIESRPILDSDFEYYFYLDFTGNVRDEDTLNLLCQLSEELPQFGFLGNYKEILI